MRNQWLDSTTRISRVLLTFAFVLVSARLPAGDGLGRVTYRIAYADGRFGGEAGVRETIAYGKSDAVGKNRAVFEFLGSPQRTLMKLFEFGGRPMFYYTDYRKDVPAIARVSRAWQPLRHLQKEFIREHVELSPEVFATRYENGEELVTNYSAATFRYRGREVGPESYEFYPK